MTNYINNTDLNCKPLSDLHAIALSWAEVGWPVFPCQPGGKVPLIAEGYLAASTDTGQIDRWWREWPSANVGLVPGADNTVLDIEVAAMPRLMEFQKEYGAIPPTYTVETWSGGRHYYLAGESGRHIKPFGGYEIDVLGRKGYVMAPGSIVNGKEYKTIHDAEFADAPAWLALALRAKREARRNATPGAKLDHPSAIEKAKVFLRDHAKPAEGERNDETFKVVCILKDWGLQPLTIMELIEDHWETFPQIEDDEIELLVKSAFKNGQNAPACDAPKPMAEVFAGVKAPAAPEKERSKYQPIDLLQTATGPEPEYHDDDEGHGRGIMPDYPEGAIGYHYARPGQHKTNCLLCESLEGVKRGKRVVFVAAEGTYEFVRVRLTVMCREMGIPLDQLVHGGDGPHGPLGRLAVIGDAPPLLNEAEVEAFMAALPWAPHIVIIDTLSEALPGADQSSTVTTSAVGHAAKLIKKRFKCLVIFIHHPGKDESRGLLGGQGFGGHGDFVIHYTYDETAGTVAAYVEKMRSGPDHFSKGFRVRQVDYVKAHKLTGEPITLRVPVVERIPVAEWAAMLATEATGGVRAIVDPSIPVGLDDAVRPLFELLRRLDREDREAGRPVQEHRVTDLIEKLHPIPQGADWATQEQQRLDISAHGEAIKRRKAKAEKDRCGALWELAVKDAAGNIRVRPAIFLKLPDNYREPGTKT